MKPDPIRPIHVDDAQYALLTRALRPEFAPVCRSLESDPSDPNVSAVVDKASQAPVDPPPGTPIV